MRMNARQPSRLKRQTVIKSLDDVQRLQCTDKPQHTKCIFCSKYTMTDTQYDQMYTECTFPETERECWELADSTLSLFIDLLHPRSYIRTQFLMHTWKTYVTNATESAQALKGRHGGLPAKVPLWRHSLMRLALRTWKALVISWFMKLSLLRTLATIIRRSNTSRSSAIVATCIRSPRPSSRLPVYRY